MPKPGTKPTRKSTTWLVATAVAAVLLATGLYGARTGWFRAEDADEFTPPKLGQTHPARTPDLHENAIARAEWGAPAGAPLVGVGGAVSAEAPTNATLAVVDGRADVGIRVPRRTADGKPYNAYSLELRVGDRRVWGSFMPAAAAKGRVDAIGLSLNVPLMRSAGADAEPITVVVGGTAMPKGDTLGIVRLALQQAP